MPVSVGSVNLNDNANEPENEAMQSYEMGRNKKG